jgi:hypothetical protein
MTTLRTHFAYRIDRWDITGETVIEHVAGAEDLIVARAAYEAACQRCRFFDALLRLLPLVIR